jgi:hypothetical protein
LILILTVASARVDFQTEIRRPGIPGIQFSLVYDVIGVIVMSTELALFLNLLDRVFGW